MKTFGEASALIASHVAPLEIETVPLSAGAGRVLAADIRAAIPSPRHSVSAMDGYAVRESDIAGVNPSRSRAKRGPAPLSPASCRRERRFASSRAHRFPTVPIP